MDWQYTNNQVVLGSHRHSELNTYEISRDIIEKIDHPGYSFHMNMLPHNDLLLLKLSEPVEMSEGVSPACLAPEGDYTAGRHCYVSGWGTVQCKSVAVMQLSKGCRGHFLSHVES